MPLSLGGAPIAAGDLLVGDRDGVTVVPQARIDEVIAALGEVRRREAETQARIALGRRADRLGQDPVPRLIGRDRPARAALPARCAISMPCDARPRPLFSVGESV